MRRYSRMIAVIAGTAGVYVLLFALLISWSDSVNKTTDTPLLMRELALGAMLLLLAFWCHKAGTKNG